MSENTIPVCERCDYVGDPDDANHACHVTPGRLALLRRLKELEGRLEELEDARSAPYRPYTIIGFPPPQPIQITPAPVSPPLPIITA
jgi:hypothetical protein